jgi:cytidylate kinase
MDSGITQNTGSRRVLERRLRTWEIQRDQQPARPGQPVKVYPYVSLSRDAGSGADEIAALLSTRLGWDVYDKRLLEHMASDDGVRRRVYGLMDEREENFLADILRPIALGRDALRNDYFRRLRMAVATIVSRTSAIFLGRGTVLLLPPDAGLRVRIIAPRDVRVAHYARHHNVDPAAAAAQVGRIDQERKRFLESHFGPDADAPERYDLTINTACLSAADAAEIIAVALRCKTSTSGGTT